MTLLTPEGMRERIAQLRLRAKNAAHVTHSEAEHFDSLCEELWREFGLELAEQPKWPNVAYPPQFIGEAIEAARVLRDAMEE